MKKQKNVIRSTVARAMAVVMAVTAVSGSMFSIPARAEGGAYPYMIFAASDGEGAVTFHANNVGLNGSVATNGTVAVIGGNCNINGTRTERAGESGEPVGMPDLRERIENTYFAAGTEEHAQDYALEEININVNTPIEGNGEVSLSGNINLNAGIMAQEDIVLDGEVKNSGDVALYSASGNIIIDSTNVNLNGLAYAPYGEIRITAMNVNMNNVILIAQKVTVEANGINGGMNQEMAQFIGTEYNVIEGGAGNDNPAKPENPDPEEPEPTDPDIDWSVDTDGDGLPDVLEEEIGTDPEAADTDGDGLSDYEEAFTTGTDPLNPSSVQTGVSDAAADSDGDGISNREELDKGLSPANTDSDYDGISDYDELYVYGTDPAAADSDGDGIKDGDEISLGLDPLNGSTNGVPDGECIIHQAVGADSEALSAVNTADSPYRLSIEADAAGYVAGNLDAGETPYAYTIDNDAILGNAVGLEYQDGNVESVTLKFEIAEPYRENEVGMFPGEEEIEGIKRLNVFKYFEDMNMLLPIETKFDMENNIVYTEVDEFGTYCLMDMEKWLLNFDLPETEAAALDIDPYETGEEMQQEEEIYFGPMDEYNEEGSIWQEGETIEPEELESLVIPEDVPMLMAEGLEEGVNNDIDNANIDIVFILQCAGLSPEEFQQEKALIVEVAQKLETRRPDASVRIGVLAFHYNYAEWLTSGEGKWFASSASLKNVLNRQGYGYITNSCRISEAFELFCDTADLREDASRFVYTLYNGNIGYGLWDFYTQHSICNKFDIHYSEIYPKGYRYLSGEREEKILALIEDTKGIFSELSYLTADEIYEHIRQNPVPPVVVQPEFTVIIPTGWNQITLTQPLDSANGANSDTDSLTDWEEVNTNLISWDAQGQIVLPTIYECMQSTQVSYAQSGLDRYLSSFMTEPNLSDCLERVDYVIHNCEILPIYSNPVDGDTDQDGIFDGKDIRPMEKDDYAEKYVELINNECIGMDTLIQTEDGFTICMTPLSEILMSNSMNYPEHGLAFFSNNENGMSMYGNCWYLCSVGTIFGEEFSFIKLRNKTHISDPGVSVSFVAFNMDLLKPYNQLTGEEIDSLNTAMMQCMSGKKSVRYSSILTDYYGNPCSDALYLIADLYIRDVLENECGESGAGRLEFPNYFPCEYAMNTLEKYLIGGNSEEQIYECVDASIANANWIQIKNVNNPTLAEEQCILAIRTCNPNFDSFAAEIVWHAVCADIYSSCNMTYKSLYVADLCVADREGDILIELFNYNHEIEYKSQDSYFVEIQQIISGGR